MVSIVEVIKREYNTFLESLPIEDEGKGKGKAMDLHGVEDGEAAKKREGLHQYTILTTFESLGLAGGVDEVREGDDEKEKERQELIAMNWLTGKAGKGKRYDSLVLLSCSVLIRRANLRDVICRPRVKHTPCMVIVLSTEPLKSLDKTAFSQVFSSESHLIRI